MTRHQLVEALYRMTVRENAEKMLAVMAPDEMIDWGALNYKELLKYLMDKIKEEVNTDGQSE